MAENVPEPTHRPAPGAELEPRGYSLVANLFPPINLGKGGYGFASEIADYVQARSIVVDPQQWTLDQPLGPDPRSSLRLIITRDVIQFDVSFPDLRMDRIVDRCKMVMQVFGDKFKPKMVLRSGAKFTGTMQIQGDAREFLVRHVTGLDPQRFTLLHRPIHVFGIRVFCPPFEQRTKKGKKILKQQTPWHVDIKAESLLDDPSKLYLEADAQWPAPKPWEQATIDEIAGHLPLVASYLGKDVMEFLQNPKPSTNEGTT